MDERPATPTDPYRTIADLYDLEHDQFHDDIDLLLQFAEAAGGSILEMACGSGRVLAPLAEAGHTVVGLDQSPAMLDRARARLEALGVAGRVTLVETGMTSDAAKVSGPFGLIAFTLNALMHLASPELQTAALARARTKLASDGVLIIDLMNPAPDYLVGLAAAPALEWSMELDDGSSVDKWAVRRISAVDQIIATTLWYDRTGSDGSVTRRRTSFDLRYLHPHELRLMLTGAGFHDILLYGGYELEALDDASERIIVTAAPDPRRRQS